MPRCIQEIGCVGKFLGKGEHLLFLEKSPLQSISSKVRTEGVGNTVRRALVRCGVGGVLLDGGRERREVYQVR